MIIKIIVGAIIFLIGIILTIIVCVKDDWDVLALLAVPAYMVGFYITFFAIFEKV